MKLTLKFKNKDNRKKKAQKVVISVPDSVITLVHLRQIWEFEQMLNQIPMTDTHVDMDVERG